MMGTWRARTGAICAAAGVLLIGLAIQGPPATAAVNSLSQWSKQGATGAGTWVLSGDGNSVTQTINGAPTFFVSPFLKETATFTVDITPATSSDNDYVGVVLGYTDPINDATCGSANCDNNYILLDWRQEAEGGQEAGYRLTRVNGSFNIRDTTDPTALPCFGDHVNTTSCTQLAAPQTDPTLGWTEGAVNTLKFTYGPGQVKVERVGSLATTTIFDVTGVFPTGRIGLYNYSQANVTYAVNDLADPTAPTTTTTVPATTTTTVAATSTSRTPTTLAASIVRTGPNGRAAQIQLTIGALLIVGGALMISARGKRPSGDFYS